MDSKTVYIIGGGPSLKGFPFQKLKGLNTIAVNMSALDVPEPTFSITADSRIFRKLCEGFFDRVSTSWVLVTNPEHASMKWRDGKFIHERSGYVYDLFKPNIVIRNAGTDGIGFTFDQFKTGYNSGFCAFQLAVLLGYQKICLLGFDLNPKGGSSHYHNKYSGANIPKDQLDRYYNNFVKALDSIQRETNIEVVSCSKESRLNNNIVYETFEDSLMEARLPKLKSKYRLSILICSIEGRDKVLRRLLNILRPQKTKAVEIIVEKDNCEITTGAKRNVLLHRARGEYVAFVDDDDMVADDYVAKILQATKNNPDCVGLEGLMTRVKKGREIKNKFIHSLQYPYWYQEKGVYYRCPNHLNPVKRELALQVGYLDVTVQEDLDYSTRLRPLLKTEEYITGTMYFYLAG